MKWAGQAGPFSPFSHAFKDYRDKAVVTRPDHALIKELGKLLAPSGFKRSKHWNFDATFVRETPLVRQGVNVSTNVDSQGLLAVLDTLGIRFHSVEEFVARFEIEPELPKDLHGLRSTFIVRLPRSSVARPTAGTHGWVYEPSIGFTAHSLEEVKQVASAIANYVAMKIEPILTRLSDVESAFEICSRNDPEHTDYQLEEHRAKCAIAFAIVLGRQEDAKRIAKVEIARLKGRVKQRVHDWAERAFRANR